MIVEYAALSSLINGFFENLIPKKVNEEIKNSVQTIVNTGIEDFFKDLNRKKNIFILLGSLSLALTITRYYVSSREIDFVIFFVLYAIPFYMSVSSILGLYKKLNRISCIESMIQKRIEDALNTSGVPKKLLFKIYEKRSLTELSRLVIGELVVELIEKTKSNKKIIFQSLLSYFVSFINLFLIRVFLL